MDDLSFLSNAEHAAIEDIYARYKQNPDSVDQNWQLFFKGFEFSGNIKTDTIKPDEFKVIDLINEYRKRGHLFTKTNPVRTRRQYTPTLDIENFGLTSRNLQEVFKAGSEIGIGDATLEQIINHLQKTYCQSIGVEYAYIRKPEIYEWLMARMEQTLNTPHFGKEKKERIFERLTRSVLFEKFLHKKFIGQKRFSLQGGESLIPALDAIVNKGSELGVQEFVIGMPHRGRLNVLAHILNKPYEDIFNEFEGKELEDENLLGDVKYHLGFSSETQTISGHTAKISLVPNPSHLETVGPVVQGVARSRMESAYDNDHNKLVPIVLHGDASIAGQGVVYEMMQMEDLNAYAVGGVIHLIVNNQVGFTTNYLDARSSVYCTDVAKTTQNPIFHVNSDDVEAVIYTIELAMEFRQRFHKDVFIDLLGYRRFGHNEGDEPRYTQPTLYKIIDKHPDAGTIYADKLIAEGSITRTQIENIQQIINNDLENELLASKQDEKTRVMTFHQPVWKTFRYANAEDFILSTDTKVEKKVIQQLTQAITMLPQGKYFYKKIIKLMEERNAMVFEKESIDWGMAETLAYASLLNEGYKVRMSGQDCQRGTFSHRHAVLTMEDSEETYTPLQHISAHQAPFHIYNSLLSEYAVLGFEYGYALANPYSLTLWEAQFGDFINGAQIIIDQYLVSAEEKWRASNGLVLLLPHGYEGQGSEHSSARVERFLQQCAENNIQVANCTTPANFFHLLRRQVHRDFRKPLVVFTPKSLLRHPACVSTLDEFASGHFNEVIDDVQVMPENVTRVNFCSGKIYYELIAEREKRQRNDVAIIRIEQLYPFPLQQLEKIKEKYNKAELFAWVQEEPANMGAWSFVMRNFKNIKLLLVARPESGSPATGSFKLHVQQQSKIIDKSFGDCTCENRNKTCKMVCSTREWKN